MKIDWRDCPAKSYCKGYNKLCSSMCVAFNQLKELYDLSNIPLKYKEIKELSIPLKDMKEYQKVTDYIENIKENVKNGKGLYIYSQNTGNGKTQTAINILHYYFKAIAGDNFGVGRGVFVNLADFFIELKASFAFKEEQYEVEKMKKLIRIADLVVFDDIGSERPTDFVVEILYKLINERYNNQKAMIFTSNYSLTDLSQWHTRIASRIQEVCETVYFKAGDYRVKGE